MKSGWLINYKNGSKTILTEEKYVEYNKEKDKTEVVCEEHWFDIEKAKEKNPNVKVIE